MSGGEQAVTPGTVALSPDVLRVSMRCWMEKPVRMFSLLSLSTSSPSSLGPGAQHT